MSRAEFLMEMAKLAAAYPYYAPSEMTWEVYWTDLHWIPTRYLVAGIERARMTSKFMPTVSEIIQESIGHLYSAVKVNPYRPTTITDIIRHFKADHAEATEPLLTARRPFEQATINKGADPDVS